MEVVEVSGLERRFRFVSGTTVEEAVDFVAKEVSLAKDLLHLQMVVDGEELVLRKTSVLVPGSKYQVRQAKISSQPNRTFAVGIAVLPSIHYYVPSKVDNLVRDLSNGKYCVLLGPRQSGKTTSALAAMDIISKQTDVTVVYLDGVVGRPSWDSSKLWSYLWDSLHFKCPALFKQSSQGQPCEDIQFKSLFLKSNLYTPVTLVLDEADSLLNLSTTCLDEFFHGIRALKQDTASYNLRAFLLIGVETVRDLLEGQYDRRVQQAQRSTTPSRLSPFPHDHVLPASRFELEEIEHLLSQAAADSRDVRIDIKEIATSIMQWTAGHKGLSGTCLAYLVQENLWSYKQWLNRAESNRLGTYIFGQATYSRILSYVRDQARDPQLSHLVLELLSVEKKVVDPEVVGQLRDWIAHGVIAADVDEEENEVLRISSPLLRTAMLRACVITSNNVDEAPPGPFLDRKWVILQALATLDGESMCRPECTKADGSPAEYMHQFLFMCRVKAVLQQAYASVRAKVIPEVKEVPRPGVRRSQLRLDTLVRDSDNFSKFGFELVANGNSTTVWEHVQKAKTYQRQHSAQVYIINFCMDKMDEVLVTPDHDSLVFISVNFSPSNGVAKVTFVEPSGDTGEVELTLKNWDGTVSFV